MLLYGHWIHFLQWHPKKNRCAGSYKFFWTFQLLVKCREKWNFCAIFVHDSWKNLNLRQKGGTTTLINSPYCVEPIPHSHQCSCYSCYLHLFLLRCFPSNPFSSALEQIAGGHLTKKECPKWTTSGMDVSSIIIKCINLSPIFDVHLCEIVGAGSRERAQELSLLYRWQVQAGNCPD